MEKKGLEIVENDVKIYTEQNAASAKGTVTVRGPVGTASDSQILRNRRRQAGQKGKTEDKMGMHERTIDIPAEYQMQVFGQFDSFAKKIERRASRDAHPAGRYSKDTRR